MRHARMPAPLLALLALLWLALPAVALDLPEWLRFGSEAQENAAIRPVVSVILEDHGVEARWIPGMIESRTQVDMAFQTLGRMTQRHVDLGDAVQKGDLLAELATEDLAAKTRSARAELQSAEVQLETAQTTLDRTRALVERHVASAAQLEQANRAALAASAAVSQARGELVRAEDAEGFARMTAPFAGVVSAIYEAPGAVVDAGAPILQLAADDELEAVIDLPESALAGLPPKATFTIWHRNQPEDQFPAVLDRIDPLADSATRTRHVHLSLPDSADFRLGSLIRARLGTSSDPALVIPAQAIFQREGQDMVWRVRREAGQDAGNKTPSLGRVEAVAIETGPRLGDLTVVTKGLQKQDEIVIRGVHSLQDGQAVGRRVEP